MSWLLAHPDEVGLRLAEHLWLSGPAMALALAIALPLGLLTARRPRLDGPVLGLLGLIYTVPSLALFVALIPVLGLGRVTAITALVAYAQVALVRNVVTGLRGVDGAVRESAVGLGMGPASLLWRVELPLAMPAILAGVRIAAVSTIALACLGALIDAGGLGTLLFQGVAQGHGAKIRAGAIAVSALALAFNAALGRLEARARRATGS
jgi:osmoprotectant transport system permease protein